MQLALFGATGKTGRRVLEQGLEAGHTITALVRDRSRLTVSPERVTVVEGDIMNPDDVAATVKGADAVIMAAGPVKGSPVAILEKAAGNIVGAMKDSGVERVVWLTGAGVTDERDGSSFSRALIRGLMKLVAGKVLAGSERAYRTIVESGLDYTIARPPMLADEPGGKNLEAGYTPPRPIPVGRGDLAGFLLRAAVTGEYSRESPLLTYTERGA